MSEKTKISWCDSTLNPVHGCDKVSAGCLNCYITTTTPFRVSGMKHGDPRTFHPSAFKLAEKLNRKPWVCDECGHSSNGQFDECECGGVGAGVVKRHRRRIFWGSLADWLDLKWKPEWRAGMLDTIRRCDQCVHILVSKRWENWRNCIEEILNWQMATGEGNHDEAFFEWLEAWTDCVDMPERGDIPQNIIGLCSVENQEMADARIPHFLTVPLACRGLSMEPLLGPVDLSKQLDRWDKGFDRMWPAKDRINWYIIGGESGPKARPCNVDWIRSIVEQGKAAGVPTFVKQLGAHTIGEGFYHFTDKKGGDPAEWPADLRVQQWPKGF